MEDNEFLTEEELYEGKSFAEYMKQFHGEDTPLKARLRKIEEEGYQEGFQQGFLLAILQVIDRLIEDGVAWSTIKNMLGGNVFERGEIASRCWEKLLRESDAEKLHLEDK